MGKTTLGAAIGAAILVAAGVAIDLSAGTCLDLVVVCDTTTVDSKTQTIPHVETVTLRGGTAETGKLLPGCRELKRGQPYTCAAIGSAVTQYDAKSQPAPEYACSSGAKCTRVGEGPLRMGGAPSWKDGEEIPRGCNVLAPKTFAGDGCLRTQCIQPAEEVSGVGAYQPLGAGPAECGCPPRLDAPPVASERIP
jgi:hypothetical protein